MLVWLCAIAMMIVATAALGVAGLAAVSGPAAALIFGAFLLFFLIGLVAIAGRDGGLR